MDLHIHLNDLEDLILQDICGIRNTDREIDTGMSSMLGLTFRLPAVEKDCGREQQPVCMNSQEECMAIEVNAETFEKEVTQSEVPVLVDFWGPQCRPCLALMPQVERLEEKYVGKIKI